MTGSISFLPPYTRVEKIDPGEHAPQAEALAIVTEPLGHKCVLLKLSHS